MNTEQRLLNLKTKMKTAEEKRSRAEGALEQLYARLKKEFSVSTLEEGEELLKKLRSEAAALADQIDSAVQELEEKYGS